MSNRDVDEFIADQEDREEESEGIEESEKSDARNECKEKSSLQRNDGVN